MADAKPYTAEDIHHALNPWGSDPEDCWADNVIWNDDPDTRTERFLATIVEQQREIGRLKKERKEATDAD